RVCSTYGLDCDVNKATISVTTVSKLRCLKGVHLSFDFSAGEATMLNLSGRTVAIWGSKRPGITQQQEILSLSRRTARRQPPASLLKVLSRTSNCTVGPSVVRRPF